MNLDCDLQRHEYEGDTVDEVANAVAREFGNDKPDQDEHSHDENSENELNEGEEEAPENRFVVKTSQDLEDVLSSLEQYCFDAKSDNLPLMYKIRSDFANEKIQATVYRQSRLSQNTLDSFVIVK